MEMNQAKEMKQAQIQITGMTCAACANRIEKSLSKLEGVAEANVNFALEKATVIYDPSKVDLSKMEQSIEKLGYGTAKEAVDLQISGMTCAACANRIEKGLNKLSGVTRANVNFALETAHVEYSPSAVSVEEMIRKVEQLGYKAIPKEGRMMRKTIGSRKLTGKNAGLCSRLFFPSLCFGRWSATFRLRLLFGCHHGL